jgi:hypothetical protein
MWFEPKHLPHLCNTRKNEQDSGKFKDPQTSQVISSKLQIIAGLGLGLEIWICRIKEEAES